MFTAIVQYRFRPEGVEAGVKAWETVVLDRLRQQPGFVRVQLLVKPEGEVMAIGTWEAPEFAQAFMRTGVYAELLKQLEPLLVETPVQGPWEQRHFIESEHK